jgi:hypothetical protein
MILDKHNWNPYTEMAQFGGASVAILTLSQSNKSCLFGSGISSNPTGSHNQDDLAFHRNQQQQWHHYYYYNYSDCHLLGIHNLPCNMIPNKPIKSSQKSTQQI